MAEPIIELTGLTKRYGIVPAVDHLTLSIDKGEIFGLLGPNGAGKSTTILMMLGLSEPTSGSAKVCGIDATRNPMQVKKKVGYLPDDIGFYEDRTGLENLIYTAMLNRISRKEARIRAAQLLERVGLGAAAHKKTGAYSRGMRQRLGLADVLIKKPEVIILDEPTLGIDPEGVRELLELIRRLSRDEGITVLLSSHQLHQVQQICDRVGLFVAGKLLALGDVAALSADLFVEEPLLVEAEMAQIADGLLERLQGTDGVKRIERVRKEQMSAGRSAEHAAGEQFLIYCARDITAELARIIVDSGSSLHALNKKEYGLDEIYHRYFEGRGSA